MIHSNKFINTLITANHKLNSLMETDPMMGTMNVDTTTIH